MTVSYKLYIPVLYMQFTVYNVNCLADQFKPLYIKELNYLYMQKYN